MATMSVIDRKAPFSAAGQVAKVLALALGLSSAVPMAAQAAKKDQVTFHKDILPLLQRSCQNCHRPTSVAPMSLLTYEQAREYPMVVSVNGDYMNRIRMRQAAIRSSRYFLPFSLPP